MLHVVSAAPCCSERQGSGRQGNRTHLPSNVSTAKYPQNGAAHRTAIRHSHPPLTSRPSHQPTHQASLAVEQIEAASNKVALLQFYPFLDM